MKSNLKLKAISIHQPYVDLILQGKKTLEIRKWKTHYRGDLLICSTKKPYEDKLCGYALCIVELVDCIKMLPAHTRKAHVDYKKGYYSWRLKLKQIIKPFPIKGQQGFYNVSL